MKRIVIGISVALLMFIVGFTVSWFYPTFTMTGNVPCDDSHCNYFFKTTIFSDPYEIALYNEFTSAEESRLRFEQNLKDGHVVIEHKDILNEQRQKIGERGIVQYSSPYLLTFLTSDKAYTRIFWTDGSEYWQMDAPTLRLALKFEESDSFQTALKINKLTRPRTK
jgi:hypothetical protein